MSSRSHLEEALRRAERRAAAYEGAEKRVRGQGERARVHGRRAGWERRAAGLREALLLSEGLPCAAERWDLRRLAPPK